MSFLLLRLCPNRDPSALMAYLAINKYSFVVGAEFNELAPWATAAAARDAEPGNMDGKTAFPYDPPGGDQAFSQAVKIEPPDAFIQQNMTIHADTTNCEPIPGTKLNGAILQTPDVVGTFPDAAVDAASQEIPHKTHHEDENELEEGEIREENVQEENVDRGMEQEFMVGGFPGEGGATEGAPKFEEIRVEEAMEVALAPADLEDMDLVDFEDYEDQSDAVGEESDRKEGESPLTDTPSSKCLLPVFKCREEQCSAEFRTMSELVEHMTNTHPNHNRTFSCKECHCLFASQGNLQRHRKKFHEVNLSFKCTDCGRAFDAWQVLHEHHQIYANRPHLFCEPCNLTVDLAEFPVHEQSLYHRFAIGEQKPEESVKMEKQSDSGSLDVHMGQPIDTLCDDRKPEVNLEVKQKSDGGHLDVQMEQPIDTPCDDRIDDAAQDVRMDDDNDENASMDSQDLSGTPFSSTSHPWTCPVKECGAGFTFQKHLLSHVDARHPNTLPFVCGRCSEQFTYSSQMYKHMRNDHGENWTEHPDGYTCEKCHRVFSQASNYRSHRVAYEHRPHFYCEPCHMTVDDCEYDKHQQMKHRKEALKKEREEREDAVKMEPREPPQQVTGSLRLYRLPIGRVKTEQKKEPPRQITPPPLPDTPKSRFERQWLCPIPYCGSPAFGFQKSMIAHVFEEHPGQKPFWCRRCPRQFNAKGLLDRHMETWHGVVIPRSDYKCDDCGKVYHRQVHLQRHMENFKGKPHVCCDKCDVVIETELFERHQKTHDEEEKEVDEDVVTSTWLEQSMDVDEEFDYVIDAVYDYEWEEDELLDPEDEPSSIGEGIRPQQERAVEEAGPIEQPDEFADVRVTPAAPEDCNDRSFQMAPDVDLGEMCEMKANLGNLAAGDFAVTEEREVGPIQQPDEFPDVFAPPAAPEEDCSRIFQTASDGGLEKVDKMTPNVENLSAGDVAETGNGEVKTEETVDDHEYGRMYPAEEKLFRETKEEEDEEAMDCQSMKYPLTPPCSVASNWQEDAADTTHNTSSISEESALDASMSEEKYSPQAPGLNACYLRWKCPVRRCGEAFRWERLLIDHMAEHPGQKPFHCSLCPRKFSSNGHLLRHKRKNHGDE